MVQSNQNGPPEGRTLSPLALELAQELNAGKSLQQIRAQRPDLSDEQMTAFVQEVFALIGLPPAATTASVKLLRRAGKRESDFAANHYFRLRIVLDEVKPQVWRKLVVPAWITLDRLHDVLQVIMGWTDSHLHSFRIGEQEFTEGPEEPEQGIEETGVVLGMLVQKPRTRFTYLYDFGDGWSHTLTVQSVERIPEGHGVRVTCLGGKRRCPPEDVGGARGYAEFLDAIANPKHEEHRSYLDWCGGSFEPEEFDAGAVNLELAKLERWSRGRK